MIPLAMAALLAPQEGPANPPATVHVGVYLNQIHSLSLKENSFVADFYVWFRWTDPGINPLESFELVNGRIESKDGAVEKDLGNGVHYASCRVVATVTNFWEISRFPLDDHTLALEIEDGEFEEFLVAYELDRENCGLSPGVQVPGWDVGASKGEVRSHTYTTNYGDTSLPTNSQSVYSRFVFSIEIVRPGYGYYLKLFFAVLVATLVAFLAFFIKPTDLDPRFGLGVGAIFAAVASEYVVSSTLPDTQSLTLADKLHMLAFAFIFLSIAESTLSLRLFSRGHEGISRWLDRAAFWICFPAYAALNFWITMGR